MNLEELQKRAHETAVAKGWHESTLKDENGKPTVTQLLAWLFLALSEIAEAEEETELHYVANGKPEGKVVELADAFIRLLDTAGACGYETIYVIPAGDAPVETPLVAIANIGEFARLNGVHGFGTHFQLYSALTSIRVAAVELGYTDEFERVIVEKMDYNETRPHRHGGKLA
jgi:hypothetical protein